MMTIRFDTLDLTPWSPRKRCFSRVGGPNAMTHWLIIARGCACTWCVPGLTQCCFVALQQLVACVCQRSSDSAAMAMTTSDAAAVPGTPAAAACFGRGYCGGYCGVPGAKWCGVQSKQCPWTRKYETYHPTYIKLSDPTPKGPPAYNIYVMILGMLHDIVLVV